tara:strand:- start:35517 stop:35819 length:303 start_codon:yes stop_codon:yes gene_type:complete
MSKLTEVSLGVLIFIGAGYCMLAMITYPASDYITRIDIEGRDTCIHADNTNSAHFYIKWCGLHTKSRTAIIKDGTTLEDVIERVGNEYRAYDNLKNKYKR